MLFRGKNHVHYICQCFKINLAGLISVVFKQKESLRVCLVEWILGRMKKKKKRENEEGKLVRGGLGWREGEKSDGGAWVFSPSQINFFKMERKEKRK